ncbi:MAG: hypothetical protein HY894_04725 [Deltaproteobacteria bacterium]|nr:hypothetical protein [Deltaproteobacteria bacterium]
MIREMRRIQIIGPKGQLDECIKTLHATSVVHIEAARPDAWTDAGADVFLKRLPIEKDKLIEKESLERAKERLRNLIFLLNAPEHWKAERVTAAELRGRIDALASVEERVKEARASMEGLLEELSAINKYEKLILGFAPVVSTLGGLKNFEIAGLTIERQRAGVLELLASEINKITEGGFELRTVDIDEAAIGVVIAYPKRFDAKIRCLLSGKSINEIRLPDAYAELTLLNALKLMRVRKAELPGLIDGCETALEAASNEGYGVIKGALAAIDDAIDEIGALDYAGQTRFTFVIEGWAPATDIAVLKDGFRRTFGGTVLVRDISIGKADFNRVPVCIDNPGYIRPFEVFLGALPPPKYGSVDPTPYVALFFPIFFGIMVGDAGYGAVILLIGLYLRRRFAHKEKPRAIASVLAISSVSAAFFGVLFGEFFGDLGMRLGVMRPILIHRAEALKTMMAITLGIGAGHVMLGVIIGAANHFRHHKIAHACAKLSYLSAIVSFLTVVCGIMKVLPRGTIAPGAAAFVVSMIALTALEGALGPIEMVKAVGNILSYVRIMAVGTASVVMANVANKIGGLSDSIIIGIIVAGAIHALNIILSMVSPVIQSMRLQYVEFFSKFFEAGGVKYEPFKKR